MAPSIFSRIVAGEIPCHKVYEDEHPLAFLDIAPVQLGHTLVIPKTEVDYMFDLDAEAYTALWNAVRTVEAKLRHAMDANRIVLQVQGYEVPHVHVHLIPTRTMEDVPFPLRLDTDHEAFARIAERIANA